MIYEKPVILFGDRLAATAFECSKKEVADQGKMIDEIAAVRIREEMYVDDGASGGTLEEVQIFVGEKDENNKYNGTIQQIFDIGGFVVKDFVWLGRDDDETAVLLGNSVLGYKFDAKSDLMAVKFRVNLSKKKKKIASQSDLTIQDLERLRSIKLTKRNLLGLPAGIFDPMGIASQYYYKAKNRNETTFRFT